MEEIEGFKQLLKKFDQYWAAPDEVQGNTSFFVLLPNMSRENTT